MRIVFFSHYYPPEVNAPASRTSEHCCRWARAGHEVTVITCAPNHPSGKVYAGYKNHLYQMEMDDGVRVIRLWTFMAANERFLGRTLNYASYLVAVTLALPRLPAADVVVSTSPQFFCGLAGLVARSLKRSPWVLEIRDLWPESIVTVGAMRKGLAVRVLEWLEHLAYRHADRIVSVTNSFVPHIAEHCDDERKIVVIKNGVDLGLFKEPERAADIKRELGLNGRFVAAYVGTHGMAHGLDTILDAAERLRDNPRIAFQLVGDGAERARLARLKRERELDNVFILGQRPKAEMPGIWAATDVSLILLRRSDAFKKVIPSKMFEAMAMRRPIILGVEGEARELLKNADAGIAIAPESAEELAAAVLLLAENPDLAARYGDNGASHVRQHYDRTKLADRYLEILTETAAMGRDRRSAVPGDGRQSACGAIGANAMHRAARAFAFGRHIPPTKLARRLELALRRSIRDRFRMSALTPSYAMARPAAPPQQLFEARRGHLQVMGALKRFTFLGRTEEVAGSKIDWATPGPGPEHQLWRMNLHYMEYLEESPDDMWAELVADWIENNPPSRRGAWKDSWNSYAISIRTLVWMQELARRRDRLRPSAVAMVEASLIEQLSFLERNLETDLGGNHLIKNIKALIWASAYFTGGPTRRWRDKGLALLRAALGEQILGDGVHYERSPSYHCQVFADLLECRHMLGHDPFGGVLDKALERMAQAIADLSHPDGRVALFNDAGLDMARAPGECLDAYAQLFGVRPAARYAFAFGDAGYFGMRAGDTYLIADCGRIAPDDLVAHGHGDVLSFEMSVAGERIIVDQGVFEYVAGRRRQQSRSAASHNTLSFDGADQADFFGSFRCGRRPKAKVLHYQQRAQGFVLEGTHDGFASLRGSPRHVRRFVAGPHHIEIRDRIEGDATRSASIGFLLHPNVKVETEGPVTRLQRENATLTLTCSRPLALEEAVWWPDMGCEIATRRLVSSLAAGERDVISTIEVQSTEGGAVRDR
ncbi:Glycosyltransferase involved in cell wall bisynthesis [Rhizobiales bacterium GAS188]|nr:Glycosyltransferase involved in cell wall bisynthesis [Rhizobiales bacterium GAS188]